MMLKARPRSWLSGDFDVYDRSGEFIGGVDLSNWRERAELEVSGTRYEATHRAASKDFELSRQDGATILRAEKPSAFRESLHFEHGGNGYELRKESAWRRDFVLHRQGIGQVGAVRPGGMFERSWTADLPDELPPEAKLFVMWLVALLWKRQNASAGAGGAGG